MAPAWEWEFVPGRLIVAAHYSYFQWSNSEDKFPNGGRQFNFVCGLVIYNYVYFTFTFPSRLRRRESFEKVEEKEIDYHTK